MQGGGACLWGSLFLLVCVHICMYDMTPVRSWCMHGAQKTSSGVSPLCFLWAQKTSSGVGPLCFLSATCGPRALELPVLRKLCLAFLASGDFNLDPHARAYALLGGPSLQHLRLWVSIDLSSSCGLCRFVVSVFLSHTLVSCLLLY